MDSCTISREDNTAPGRSWKLRLDLNVCTFKHSFCFLAPQLLWIIMLFHFPVCFKLIWSSSATMDNHASSLSCVFQADLESHQQPDVLFIDCLDAKVCSFIISSVTQLCPTLRPHGLQHARPLAPTHPLPGASCTEGCWSLPGPCLPAARSSAAPTATTRNASRHGFLLLPDSHALRDG